MYLLPENAGIFFNFSTLGKIVKFASGFPVLTSPVSKMFTLAYGQQFPKVGKLLVYKLVNKILETVVHTQAGLSTWKCKKL